jgi:hypothetical protein
MGASYAAALAPASTTASDAGANCGGSSICEHNRTRSQCKPCGGSSICEHNRRRSKCEKCFKLLQNARMEAYAAQLRQHRDEEQKKAGEKQQKTSAPFFFAPWLTKIIFNTFCPFLF